jgi:hypothetical protein
LEDPKGGTFLPKKDIWSPYLGLIAKWKFRTEILDILSFDRFFVSNNVGRNIMLMSGNKLNVHALLRDMSKFQKFI